MAAGTSHLPRRKNFMEPSPPKFFRAIYRIRRVEEECARIYPSDQIKSPMHLSTGQEAVAVGVCEALRSTDIIFPTYRGHAAYLAKGGSLNAMMAELFGRETGCTHGKGGSMHLIDPSAGVMGASAVVGTTIAQAVGYAFAEKYKETGTVVVTFFGDGATEEGAFHESMNFAALRNLPIIFICENNEYAIHSPKNTRQAYVDLCRLAEAYGIASARIENNDLLAIYEHVSAAVERLRSGGGPVFFECMTYRWKEHVGPGEDYAAGYRSADEWHPWRDNDQVEVIGRLLDPQDRERIIDEVEAEIAAAIRFAEESPFPAAAELYTHVYKES